MGAINSVTKDPQPVSPIGLMMVVTSHVSVGLMSGQLRFLREAGFDVSVVSSPGPGLNAARENDGVKIYPVPMSREITGLPDIVSVWKLWRLMRRVRPMITAVSTPKAGLLGGIAAYLSRVPCRIYILRGLRCETALGWKRLCLVLAERVACYCAESVICVSPSLRDLAVSYRLASPDKFLTLGPGSSNGVDVDRFAPTQERILQASLMRAKLGIPAESPVAGFVGRLTNDKGVCELISAFLKLRIRFPDLYLVLIGGFEEGDPIPIELRRLIAGDSQIVSTGTVQDSVPYYHAIDVLVLPTHREGFPNVVLEAQAAAKPVVTTRATGARDAVQDGVTGTLVPSGDVEALSLAIENLLRRPGVARKMGNAGYERVRAEFRQELVWMSLKAYLLHLLKDKGLPAPLECGLGVRISHMFTKS